MDDGVPPVFGLSAVGAVATIAERIHDAVEDVPDESFGENETLDSVPKFQVPEVGVLGVFVAHSVSWLWLGEMEPFYHVDDIFASCVVEPSCQICF